MVKGFKYHNSNKSYYAYYRDKTWERGFLSEDINITISALSSVIQYGQQAFEGLKAYRRKDGGVQLFRPFENAKRFLASCQRLMMPTIDEQIFVQAIIEVVRANIDLVPSYESKGSLYIRPFMIGIGHNLGVKPSESYMFAIVVSPVGAYYEQGFKPIKVTTTSYDRVAPNGLGAYKAGANYAAGLYPKYLAAANGYDECLYLDSQTHQYLDEASATNVLAITEDGKLVTPQSGSILPSITNHSIQEIAKQHLNIVVERRSIHIEELRTFKEFGFCGTAAVITPVSCVHHESRTYEFKTYETLQKIYDLLNGIQYGDIDGFESWIVHI